MRVKEGTQFLFPKKDVGMGFGRSYFAQEGGEESAK